MGKKLSVLRTGEIEIYGGNETKWNLKELRMNCLFAKWQMYQI